MKPLLIALLSSIPILAACGGGSGGSKAAPAAAVASASVATSSSAPQPAVATDPKADLLTITDMPTGWAVDNSATDDSAAPQCLKQFKDSGGAARHGNASFVRGASTPALEQSVGTYSSPTAAAAGLARMAAVLNGCTNFTFTSSGTKITGSIGALSYPQTGDRSDAWSMTLTGEGVSFGADIILFQKGATDEDLVLLDFGTPLTDDFTAFVQKALAKLPAA